MSTAASLGLGKVFRYESYDAPAHAAEPEAGARRTGGDRPRVLIPFGGGRDSMVPVEALRSHADVELLAVGLQGTVFKAIEPPSAVAGVPLVHVNRVIDPRLLRSSRLGFLRGHMPITGITSAVAVLTAVLPDRDGVAMSNEWSASDCTLVHEGRPINRQYSKDVAFEAGFREVLRAACARMLDGTGLPYYFSALRHRTEYWIARRFAELDSTYHRTFHSCDGAFDIFERHRLDRWCGRCAKCCFIELILAPFLPRTTLEAVFDGAEPLSDESLAEDFRALVGASTAGKPFECVGEVGECQAAAVQAAHRADRAENTILRRLATEVAGQAPDPARLLNAAGEHYIPERYAVPELMAVAVPAVEVTHA